MHDSPMQTTEEYEAALRGCTRCAPLLALNAVDPAHSDAMVLPKPIVRPAVPRPVMLIGQAPGLTEYGSGAPFSGAAGRDVRNLFEECGCNTAAFEKLVSTSAVAKCFPGSKLTKRRRGPGFRREDLKPSAVMLSNCKPFLLTQLRLVRPKVVVLLGAMALETYIELRTGKRSKVSLDEYVGRVEDWEDRRVIPLAHTSGGSFWLHNPKHKALQAQAKRHLARELAPICLDA
jgi:uracil-DNA glycosylase family 4